MIFFSVMTFVSIFFILADLVPIYQRKQWGLFWIYLSAILLVQVLVLLIDFNVKIPSPAVPLEKMVSAIWGIQK